MKKPELTEAQKEFIRFNSKKLGIMELVKKTGSTLYYVSRFMDKEELWPKRKNAKPKENPKSSRKFDESKCGNWLI